MATDWPEVTAEQVRARVKAKEVTAAVSDAHETAVAMVEQTLEDAYRPVLGRDYVEAVLRVAYGLYDGAKSADGVRQQTGMDGTTPIRAPRDPMSSARPIFDRYVLQLS